MTVNAAPQSPYLSILDARSEPRMFPTDVCAFHTPMMSPLLLLPNQLPMADTTDGHPVLWNKPAHTCTKMK